MTDCDEKDTRPKKDWHSAKAMMFVQDLKDQDGKESDKDDDEEAKGHASAFVGHLSNRQSGNV